MATEAATGKRASGLPEDERGARAEPEDTVEKEEEGAPPQPVEDAERAAYARFMEQYGQLLRMGELAVSILGGGLERYARQAQGGAPGMPQGTPYGQAYAAGMPQGLENGQAYAPNMPPQGAPYGQAYAPGMPPQGAQHGQAALPDPDALVRAAQRDIDAIGDPDFTLEAVMADGRMRMMLAQGRDIYEIYGRFHGGARSPRAPRPAVEARANAGMDSMEYDFRNAPREVIDRIDAQLKRGQYVHL